MLPVACRAVKDLEAVIADEAAFAALPEEEQAAKQQELQKKRAGPPLLLPAGRSAFPCCRQALLCLAGADALCARAAGREVRYYLQTAHGCLRLIRLSTAEITAPWLTQETAHRIASTLNYFLLHLTGAS